MIGPLDGDRARRELVDERELRAAPGFDFVPASGSWRRREAFAVDEAGVYVAGIQSWFRSDRRVTLLQDTSGRIVKGYWARGSSLLERSHDMLAEIYRDGVEGSDATAIVDETVGPGFGRPPSSPDRVDSVAGSRVQYASDGTLSGQRVEGIEYRWHHQPSEVATSVPVPDGTGWRWEWYVGLTIDDVRERVFRNIHTRIGAAAFSNALVYRSSERPGPTIHVTWNSPSGELLELVASGVDGDFRARSTTDRIREFQFESGRLAFRSADPSLLEAAVATIRTGDLAFGRLNEAFGPGDPRERSAAWWVVNEGDESRG